MKILSIETSCDETSSAVLEIKNGSFKLLSHIILSQEKIHAKFGGIVPEVAARKQMEMIIPVIDKAIKKAKTNLNKIDAIACTQGPGLITSLTVGFETAKTLAYFLNKPLIPVNHLAGHLLANHLESKKINYPAIGLIVSGGHTMLVIMKSENNFKIIGQTVDDAVGEAFDKVAKILNLGYPGGPIISKLATKGDATTFDFPRPMIQQQNLDFSFSGLKTAVLYKVKKLKSQKVKKETNNICASFQQACVDVLISKTLRAIKIHQPKSFLLGGGVSANPELRKQLQEKISAKYPDMKIFIPPLNLTGDNAAMIAVAGYFKTKNLSRGKALRDKKRKMKNDFKILRADPNYKL